MNTVHLRFKNQPFNLDEYQEAAVFTIPDDLSPLIEGRCPVVTCGATLDRREHYGWCSHCRVGWAVQGRDSSTAFVYLGYES